MEKLIKSLALQPDYHREWFESATETQLTMLWDHVWDCAAEKCSNKPFVNDLYDFYNVRGYLTHKQFYFLILNTQPNLLNKPLLSDRIK